MSDDPITRTVWSAVAATCAEIAGIEWVYGPLVPSVEYEESLVVPVTDDFPAAGLPAVVVGLSDWTVAGLSAQKRGYDFLVNLWFPRHPIGEQVEQMADALDSLMDGFERHCKAKLHAENEDWNLGSAMVMGGSGIRHAQYTTSDQQIGEVYLVAPVRIHAVVDRTARYLPE